MRAIRALVRRPTFTVIATVTLAIGLGVNAAVFAVTRTVLLRSLPYRDAHRLVQVNERNLARQVHRRADRADQLCGLAPRSPRIRGNRGIPPRVVQREFGLSGRAG
jgi:hypothetical protein